ncbi:MAG: hypothetical protein Q9195_004240 [Heterodermia aff. obscurata]
MNPNKLIKSRDSDDNAVVHAKSRNWFTWSFFSELRKLVPSLPTAGLRLIKDISTGISVSRLLVLGGYVDDKTYIVCSTTHEFLEIYNNASKGERLLQLIAGLPDGSILRKALTGRLVKQLWSRLEHPPKTYLGDEYKFRTADGYNNNLVLPELGRAGSAYARSVTPMDELPAALPDASTIFDDPNKVDNSSYLDLSPLYGNNQAQQDGVRMFVDGKLKPDAFADARESMPDFI